MLKEMFAGLSSWNTECSDDAFDVFGSLAEMFIVTVVIRVTYGLGLAGNLEGLRFRLGILFAHRMRVSEAGLGDAGIHTQ